LKCRPVRKYIKEAAWGSCIGYLEKQIETYSFRIAFCLGDVTVQAFFADTARNVKSTRGTWNHVRGLMTYASYHPLAVKKSPTFTITLLRIGSR
jgi:DNA polymerase